MSFPSPLPRNNSASRLAALFAKALVADRQASTLNAWATVFGVPDAVQGAEREHEVMEILLECVRELRALRSQLIDIQLPDGLLNDYAMRPENAMVPSSLSTPWSNMAAAHLQDDVMLAFAWYSYILPEEPVGTTPEERADLSRLLDDLEEALAAPGLPQVVVDTLTKHLFGMRRALKLYSVKGIQPMRDIARAVVMDLSIDKDEIRTAVQSAGNEPVSNAGGRFMKAWKKLVELSGDAEKLMKSGQLAIDFYSHVVDKLT